jgi:hypothetical protein
MATLVAPGHGILLGLLSPFLMDEVETLIILGLVSLSWHHCHVLTFGFPGHMNTL